MRISITCEHCGRHHRLERSTFEPGPIWIVCHECELSLVAFYEPDRPSHSPSVAGEAFNAVWGDVLDASGDGVAGPA